MYIYNIQDSLINHQYRKLLKNSIYLGGEQYAPPSNIDTVVLEDRILGIVRYPEEAIYRIAYTEIDPLYFQKESLISDSLQGDYGISNLYGYFMGLLTGGPILLSAGPMASLEIFDLNSSVRLHSLNFLHNTGTGYTEVITDRTRSNKTEAILPQNSTDPTLYFDYGLIGGLYSEKISKYFYKKLTKNGEQTVFSKGDLFSGIMEVPQLETIKEEFNPNVETDKPLPEPINPFSWYGGEANLVQEYEYQEYLLGKTFQEYTINPTSEIKSFTHQRPDGSIVLMSKGGSTIEMNSEGDIVISPKRNLKIISGSNVSILGGKTVNVTSKEFISLNTTDGRVEINSKEIKTNSTTHEIISENINQYVTNSYEEVSSKKSKINNSYIEAQIIQTIATTISEKATIKNTFIVTLNQFLTNCNFKVKNSLKFLSDVFHWGGKRFKFSGTESGTIAASTPIQINHLHANPDEMKYELCGKAGRCKLVKINKQVPIPEPPFIEAQQEPSLEKKIAKLESKYPGDLSENFYLTPWMTKSKIGWSIRNVFPYLNNLFGLKKERQQWSL